MVVRATEAPRVRIGVRLTPGGGTDRIDGVVDGVLRARVAARPLDGAANEALLRLLASTLGVARSRLRVVAGSTARTKLVEVDGVEAPAVRSRWPEVDV